MSEEQRLKMAKDRKEYYATHTPAFVVASIRKRIPVLGKSIKDNEWTYYESMCHAAKAVGIDATDVRRVCNGKFKQSHGYMFKYANEREAI